MDAGDVEALVRREFDSDGNDAVELDEFLAFCRGRGVSSGKRDEDAEDLDVVSKEYEFSLDPDVRAIEKKLRRAARELAGRGGDGHEEERQWCSGSCMVVVASVVVASVVVAAVVSFESHA